MIGLDTNVLVRYITQDDPPQSARANRVVDALTVQSPGFVSLVTVVELTWVLESCYSAQRTQVAEALDVLLRTKELRVEQAETVWKALRVYRNGKADLADALIERGAAAAGCDRTLTFDRGASRHAGMELIT